MPQLSRIRVPFLSERGSTLMGAVALVAALSLAGLSFLRLAATTANDEQAMLEDARAFLGAESGAQLGARWLRAKAAWPTEGETVVPFAADLSINGLLVTVKLTGQKDSVTNKLLVEVNSEAHTGAAHSAATFRKRILYHPQRATFGVYGTFFNRAANNWGGFYNRIFNGRFHMNDRIIIHSQQNTVRFKEMVTVANAPSEHWDYGNGSHDNNNYDYGVQLNNNGGWGSDKAGAADVIFEKQYLANQDRIALPQEILDLTTGLPTHADAVTLPVSTDQGDRYSDYRPSLVYNADGSATYYYHSGGTYRQLDIADVNDVILHAQNNVNVRGTVKGNTTLVSDIGKSIVITGDLVYADYVPGSAENFGVPLASSDMLGLVTGKDITFPHQWVNTINGTPVPLGGSLVTGEMHLNASILALTDGGTESWDRSRTYNFDLVFAGNHILDMWDPPSSGTNGAKNIIFNHDHRLINQMQPHGFPYARTSGGLWQISLGGWREENAY